MAKDSTDSGRFHAAEHGGSLQGTTRMPASISLDTESVLQTSRSPEAERARYSPRFPYDSIKSEPHVNCKISASCCIWFF